MLCQNTSEPRTNGPRVHGEGFQDQSNHVLPKWQVNNKSETPSSRNLLGKGVDDISKVTLGSQMFDHFFCGVGRFAYVASSGTRPFV